MCPDLTSLFFDQTEITSINLLNNRKFEKLECSKPKLTSLDVSANKMLQLLRFNETKVSGSLNLSNYTQLKELQCADADLSGLNVTNCAKLEILDCGRNQFTTLDISTNLGLYRFACDSGKLTTLDVSSNTKLTQLSLQYSKIENISVVNNKALTILNLDLTPAAQGTNTIEICNNTLSQLVTIYPERTYPCWKGVTCS